MCSDTPAQKAPCLINKKVSVWINVRNKSILKQFEKSNTILQRAVQKKIIWIRPI